VLTTLNPDGSALQTPIWYLAEDSRIYIRTNSRSAKVGNIRRDPRVSLCAQEERPPYKGVTIKGTAIVQDERPDLSRRMARHYLGAIAGFFYIRLRTLREIEGDPDTIIVVTPERNHGWDYTPQTPLIGRLWLLIKRILPPWL
jgi:PPOX class probable F420-dependent enzyme